MSQFSDQKLLIDVGNSNIKWIFAGEYSYTSVIDFKLDMLPNSNNIWASCVAHCDILAGADNINYVEPNYVSFGLECGYDNPEELGTDRYLGLVAAKDLYKNNNIVIVDIGSAVTFDVLLSSGLHSGGLIMPGLSALRSSFDKFSTNDQSEQAAPVTSSTKDAWMSGTNLMLINAIKLQIDGYKDMYTDSTIIFTGGGAQKVLRHLSGNHKYHEDLVLYGLSIYAQSIIKKL